MKDYTVQTKWLWQILFYALTGMDLSSSVCVIIYFYFLLTPWVFVGISTKTRLRIQPRTCGNLVDRSSLIYHYARSACKLLIIADIPLHINFDFSFKNLRRYDKTQESGVGRWLIYQPLAGFLLMRVWRTRTSCSGCPNSGAVDTFSLCWKMWFFFWSCHFICLIL
jgi:hypothetical protein